jgi:hypothetical protein
MSHDTIITEHRAAGSAVLLNATKTAAPWSAHCDEAGVAHVTRRKP